MSQVAARASSEGRKKMEARRRASAPNMSQRKDDPNTVTSIWRMAIIPAFPGRRPSAGITNDENAKNTPPTVQVPAAVTVSSRNCIRVTRPNPYDLEQENGAPPKEGAFGPAEPHSRSLPNPGRSPPDPKRR